MPWLALVAVGLAILAGPASGGPPRCFGAASRDPEHGLINPALRLTVVPAPERADEPPATPCRPLGHLVDKRVCEFGVSAAEATATIALVGDSHAGHWRAALEAVAQAARWRGIHIGHASCPLS